MALALILRNANKLQGTALQLQLKNLAAPASARAFTLASYQAPQKKNTAPFLPLNNNVMLPQVRLMSSDHSALWTIERVVTVGLLGLLPATVAFPNAVLDNLAAVACVIHFHWGLEGMALDYMRPIVVGAALAKISHLAVYFISAFTLGGLIYFNVNDIGIGKTIRKFWSIKQ